MKRYDEYKQTGTHWIGEIPSHWEDSRLKYIGEYINGYAFKPEDWSSEGLPIIRIQDLTESNSNPNYFKGTINEKYLIKDGDILELDVDYGFDLIRKKRVKEISLVRR